MVEYDEMIETTELPVFTAYIVFKESESSLLTLFSDGFVGDSVRKL